MLPPRSKKRRVLSKKPGRPQEWNDGFSAQRNQGIPEYRAYNDVYAQGYVGQLKRQGGFNKYINQVAMKPGGIRPIKMKG